MKLAKVNPTEKVKSEASTRRMLSLLRYPGGKACLAPLLASTIKINNLEKCKYYEPFAGGAGAALALLRAGIVSEIHLNDADPRIFALWKTMLTETTRLECAIKKIPLNIVQWRIQREICERHLEFTSFEVGLATLYMNRCNRSGIITGSGPIGGYNQNGNYKIDARFNRESLIQRLNTLVKYRDLIFLYNMDACDFLRFILRKRYAKSKVFIYLDPPYYENGRRLYLNYYEHKDHEKLARFIQRKTKLHWIMSYDNTSPIRRLYKASKRHLNAIQYSLNVKEKNKELIFSSPVTLVKKT